MKKKRNVMSNLKLGSNEILLKMKLLTLLMFAAFVSASASSYSQATKFNLNLKAVTVGDVFQKIEEKSEFVIIYNEKAIDVNRKVDVEVNDETVEKILDQIFNGDKDAYRILDRQIAIYPNEKKESPSNVNAESNSTQQKKEISGTVKDSKGIPLPGVSVVIKGTTSGTITDSDGKFKINVPSDAKTLVFSFVGMKTQEIILGNNSSFSLTLAEEAVGLDEVVAVGYGTQRKGNLTGSISAIKSDKLTIAPISSTSNALVGQLPGLIAKQSSGMPGSDAAELNIRGFGGALVIVDGIESSLDNIDANQIESVSILKDGAASIYGARAGNGVILVTTKRGQSQKPTITLNSSSTLQGITKILKPASSGQRSEMERESWIQSGQPEGTAPWSADQVAKFYAGNDPAYPNTDWYNYTFRNWAPQQNHNLSIRGGSEKISYYGFLGYTNQETMIKKKWW